MTPPVRTVRAAVTPVSLSEAKAHLQVFHNADDELIAEYIQAATSHLDGWNGVLGRCLVTQTWQQDLDAFPVGEIVLPFPDVSGVTVEYRDTANATQTVAEASFYLVQGHGTTRIVPADGFAWPETAVRPDAVSVTMVCGYGDPEDVPSAIRAAIKLHVGVLFTGRADGAIPPVHGDMIAPHRVTGAG